MLSISWGVSNTVIGPRKKRTQLENVTLWLEGFTIAQSPCVKNVGVPFDPTLSFDQHLKNTTRTAFFHLRNIAKIRPMSSAVDAETLIHAFISSRLELGSSTTLLLFSLPSTGSQWMPDQILRCYFLPKRSYMGLHNRTWRTLQFPIVLLGRSGLQGLAFNQLQNIHILKARL